ncbi:MAG: F0F1 ATP synthase subunit A [Chloroflexi bacterium]|nr:F0F1 ATP synthase subunit A [Chloroflexota bacterium]MQC16753.1 F0F1 ATP synthase subunit A [Chloroflexota bacterium]MQC47886.1 F0F1 ATP synthase subunit A [Chloroflexota bacterium]
MKIGVIAAGLLALTLFGMLVVGGTAPYITVPPDPLWDVGGFTITNTLLTSWITVVLLILVAAIAGPRMSLVPRGFSGFVEMLLSGFFSICTSVAGEDNTKRFFPLVATIFFFVLVANWMALLPGFKTVGLAIPNYGPTQAVMKDIELPLIGSVGYVPFRPEQVAVAEGELPRMSTETAHALHLAEGEYVETADGSYSGNVRGALRPVNTDITAPMAIALFSFLFVEFWGLQSGGIGYLKKFFAFDAIKKGPMGVIDIFVGILEFVSELSRMVSFTFRLFGNIFAGSVLMLMMTFLTPFVLILPFYGLEIFVGAVQAFVFAVLTLVFAMSAIVSHHGDDHHAEEPSGSH